MTAPTQLQYGSGVLSMAPSRPSALIAIFHSSNPLQKDSHSLGHSKKVTPLTWDTIRRSEETSNTLKSGRQIASCIEIEMSRHLYGGRQQLGSPNPISPSETISRTSTVRDLIFCLDSIMINYLVVISHSYFCRLTPTSPSSSSPSSPSSLSFIALLLPTLATGEPFI